ncbi:hypothetical protein IE53DRAFT_362166 [Violaceomyces palustris]|uniref:Uncharacterized protein n=1 Tax=Violaceomyces palustris TaxID=1673888 RepID=A0ACD0NY06_9BASI|nr:hypothetical protein IE53DRAFT_362166 [Violaceomyces palustris]
MLSYEYDPVFDQIEDLFGDPLWAYDDESSKNPGQSTATQTTALSGKTKSSPSRSGPSTLNNSDNVNYLTRTYEVNGNSISRSYGDGGGRLTRQRSAELTRFAEQASTTSPKPSEEAPSKRPDDQHDRPKKSEAAKAGSHHHTVTSSIEQSSRTKNSSSPSLSLQYTSRFPKSTLSSENCIAYGYGSARYYTCKQLQNHAGSSSSGTNRPSGVETFSPDPVTKSQKSAKSESAVATGTTKPTSASTGSEANHAFSADDTSQTRTHSVLSQSSASKSSSQSRTYSFSSTDHQRTDSPTPSADPLKPVETNALPHDPLHSNGKMDDQQTSTLQHKDPNSPDRTSLTAEQGNVGESSVSRKSISGPATLGIVIGSFVFLASLAAIVFFLLKKRRREKEKERLDGCGNQSKLDEEWGGMIAPFPVASRAGAQALGHTDDEMHDIPLDSGPAYDQSFHRQVSTSIYPNVATRNEDPFGDHSIRRGPPGGQAQLSSDSAIRNRHMESPRIVGDGLGGFTSSYPPSMERQETSPQLTRPLNIVPKKMGHRPNNSQNTNVTMATTDTAGFTHGGCTASDSSSSLSISDVGHLHSIEIRNATKVPAPDQPVVATNGWFGIRMLQPLWGGTDGKPKKPDPDDEVREEEDDHPVEKERTPIPKDRQDRDPDEHGHGKDVTIFFSQSNGLTPHHFAVDSKGADFVPKTQGPWYRPAQASKGHAFRNPPLVRRPEGLR